MSKMKVRVKTLENFKGLLPAYESVGASGLDVRAQLSQALVIQPGDRAMVPTGISVEIPLGFEIQVRPRSGWAAKKGISVINSPGTIDADYRGEIKVALINLGTEAVEVLDQDRVAQLVLTPVIQLEWDQVEQLEETARGAGGFGSTGFKGASPQ
ncbi:MAG: dUTP diphosphatase [Oligoflexia bacterium]|nr:dUTP diphosphatase [Oligoflexia bacterium]